MISLAKTPPRKLPTMRSGRVKVKGIAAPIGPQKEEGAASSAVPS